MSYLSYIRALILLGVIVVCCAVLVDPIVKRACVIIIQCTTNYSLRTLAYYYHISLALLLSIVFPV